MKLAHHALLLTIALAAVGCGTSAAPTDGGGPEADSGSEPERIDGGGASDAGSESADAGVIDECDNPGEMRTASCGNCGLRSERCSDSAVWEPASTCLDEGECAVGAVEEEAFGMCGERTRICDDSCTWRDWSTTTREGECAPGASQRVASTACPDDSLEQQICSDTCVWEGTGTCSDACGGSARTTPVHATERCIPAGPFHRGTTERVDSQPVGTVTLSAYYIDAYPASNDRYRACVTAGACTPPMYDIGEASFDDPSRGAYPVQGLAWAQAEAFCTWDGRRLPTEAEWEKAARGPAPRMQEYVWGNDPPTCAILETRSCGFTPGPGPYMLPDPVDGLPTTASAFGVEMQIGGGHEWVSDWYSSTYYAEASSTADPTGPASGTDRVRRGTPRGSVIDASSRLLVGARSHGNPTFATAFSTVRCARSAP